MLIDFSNVTVKKSFLVLNLPLDKGHFITAISSGSRTIVLACITKYAMMKQENKDLDN